MSQMVIVGAIFAAVTVLCITWYCLSLRRKRQKANEVLRWIQSSLAGRGHVLGISWVTTNRFRVPLRLTCGVFHRAWVLVEFMAQPTPVQWFFNKIRGRREVLSFQADLDCPPTFSLHIQNFRWFARSSRKAMVEEPGWRFEHLPSVMISTRPQVHREVATAVASLGKGDSNDFLEVSFQRRSPHFSATMALEALAPGAPARTYMLDAMRELAGSASVS
jgi:hypothetical protein